MSAYFKDDVVREVDIADVMREYKDKHAYLLVYARKEVR
jgi:hypothetical protein